MILTSILIFFTLIYRETGKIIVHPVPVNWKARLDTGYLEICDKLSQGRLERNAALQTIFRVFTVCLLFVLVALFLVGLMSFELYLECCVIFLFCANVSNGYMSGKSLQKDFLTWSLTLSVVFLLAAGANVLFSFNSPLNQFKYLLLYSFPDSIHSSQLKLFLYFLVIAVMSVTIAISLRLLIGFINEVIYFLITCIIRFSKLLGAENALGVLFFMITLISYITGRIIAYYN